MAKKIVNNVLMDLTPEEETERIAREEQAVIDKQAEADAKTALEANRASGKAKLKTGEALNDAELSALFGD